MYRKTPNVIGLKWNFAYWRTLNIQLVTKKEAKRIYESQNNNPEAYKKLQDYLVYHVLKRCTELEFPLQIHTGLGADPGLILYESNAGLLDLIFSRPELENARVECLHGSYPYCKELSVIARRKNVWLDFSWMVLLLEPHDLARYLKEWIQITGVNKIIFGVDASGLAQVAGTWCARKALSIALTDLVQQDFYSEQQAISAARAILQKNAINFYKPTLT
jgi:predicted TIM-barrel fold metal-dependent hydrolase